MHKRSGHCPGPTPLSSECHLPAQAADTACQQQLLRGSPAQNSNCCMFPSAPQAVIQQAASSSASPPPSASCHDHTHCQADVCCRAPATPSISPIQHDRRAQGVLLHATPAVPQHAISNQSLHSQSPSPFQSPQLPASISSSSRGHTAEADQKLLWWPLDHVTVQGSRLAVGDSCYVITGHCVVCQLDNDLDMVECTRCKRFTHFACACPELTQAPQVPPFTYIYMYIYRERLYMVSAL